MDLMGLVWAVYALGLLIGGLLSRAVSALRRADARAEVDAMRTELLEMYRERNRILEAQAAMLSADAARVRRVLASVTGLEVETEGEFVSILDTRPGGVRSRYRDVPGGDPHPD